MSMGSRWKQLKRYWHIEIIGGEHKPFSLRRVRQKCKRSNRYAYVFWFRIAYVLDQCSWAFLRRRGKLLNERISRRYNVEIMLGAQVDEGLWIGHPTGIVISGYAVIGKNFKIWQNSSIGIKGREGDKQIRIGDNVRVLAHSCVIADRITIGDDVTIGAMSFVNKDIPAGATYISQKSHLVKLPD